jgi:N-acyl-D-amino-acid deacylase
MRVADFIPILCTGLFLMTAGQPRARAAERYDVIISGGRVVDGTGAPWYVADVAISGGRIMRIGRLEGAEAGRVIDAGGLVVCPGFIDMMGQTAEPFLDHPETALNLLTQGITTINAGEGHSPAPVEPREQDDRRWRTFAEYFLLLEQKGLPINVAQTVGHTQVRRVVLGEVDRRPTEDELRQMQAHVRTAMEDGTIGLSTALIYPPATYATTEEIAALASVVGESGGRYYTHMRNEGDNLLDAIDEALEIGRTGNVPVHIFHLKAAGRQNWGKIDEAIARIRAARRSGQQVTADVYPYINNGLGLESFIHPRNFAEGRDVLLRQLDNPELRARIRNEIENEAGWENWFRHVGFDWSRVSLGAIEAEAYKSYSGQTVADIAAATKADPWDVFFGIVQNGGAFAMPESMSEANVIRAMQQEFISYCTDVGPDDGTGIAAHPRAYGAFPRVLSRYVRDLGVVSLERAVAQATSVAANEIMAYDRGRIAIGQAADIAIFDLNQIVDRATFGEPHRQSEGMKFVLVNGQVVLEDGKYTDAKPGRVLRGPGYRRDLAPSQISTGDSVPELANFDALMQSFLDEHGVPGAALALIHEGRLVFARGYGYADIAAREPTTAQHLYRIASISKPITAIAILQLVEQGKLSLDDKVFDILTGYEAHLEAGKEPDTRLKDITIRQCLQHTGGWDRDKSFDAMFEAVRFAKELGVPSPAGPDEVIRCMLGQPLDFAPGERYAYSNFGYCLLGRVIERLTDQTYDQYVQTHILAPVGITDMRIGASLPSGRAANEVRYYDGSAGESVFEDHLGQLCAWPYGGWNLEAMDSHGAWIASAVDLARLAVALDDREHCALLKPESIEAMYERPPGDVTVNKDEPSRTVYYALGWNVREVDGPEQVNCWHTGSLAGTATLLVRRHDGNHFVILFNARIGPGIPHLTRAIDPILQRAIDDVQEWPDGDLFAADAHASN